MNETMMLPVEYLGASHELPLTIVPLGYTYQLHIEVEGKTLIFEKDDQGEYRVIDTDNNSGAISKGFVAAIVATLQAL
ncbi:hypothetical protein ACWKW6_25795 [Dyadobacter jiangsuensis]|uniref:hypothetical protein n=1 Tax=Dyadobacter fermentans TaxID=94254 RepID=UPI001CBC88E6|nr:hypothetical protein [Dyadobacter fermentans]MBZ1361362.1 hypothetical protein [Dyadobacter fermentans]